MPQVQSQVRYRRVTIVGMNNPLSRRPELALYPHPVGCSGWHIWQMLRARTGAWRSDYLSAFQRENIGQEKTWNPKVAAVRWREMQDRILENSDTLVLLGVSVRRATGLMLPGLYVSNSIVCLPHPSGLNRWYNDSYNRRAVELILEELYLETSCGRVRASPDPGDAVV